MNKALRYIMTEAGDESATETSSVSDSQSDDWSDTEDEEDNDAVYTKSHGSSEESTPRGMTALVPCLVVTGAAHTFALILTFCAANEIACRYSLGAIALPMSIQLSV